MSKLKILAVIGITSTLLCSCSGANDSFGGLTEPDKTLTGYDALSTYKGETQESSDLVESQGSDNSGFYNGLNTSPEVSSITNEDSEISNEILVYRSLLSIDTLDFEKSLESIRGIIGSSGGFIESEVYNDDSSIKSYEEGYNTQSNKTRSYSLTLRVPSDKYRSVLSKLSSDVGDVRSSSSTVQNMTKQYSSYVSSLKVYEQKEKRYLKKLKSVEDDSVALQIEQELLGIQVKIAEIKNAMEVIKTDANYSTINVQLKEVVLSSDLPSSTFKERLSDTVSESYKLFKEYSEELLFFVILNFWRLGYLVIGLLMIFCGVSFYKRKQRNKNVILHEEPEDIKEEDTCILKVSVEDLQKDKDS